MEILELVFYALILLFVLVTFHEFGHYWVARRCGVKVLKFSIGFGPVLFKRKFGETDFALSLIPLGGYVKMFGEGTQDDGAEITLAQQAQSFSHKSVWQRMAIVVAGPLANFILAVVFFFFVFMGGTRGIAPIVGEVASGSIAERAGLIEGAEIIGIDDKPTATWADVYDRLMARLGDTGSIKVDWSVPDSNSIQTSTLEVRRWESDSDMPDILGSLGIEFYRPETPAIIAEVVEGSAAERAGILAGDRVLTTDGVATPDWASWTEVVRASPEQSLSILLESEAGIRRTVSLIPDRKVEDGQEFGQAGVMVVTPEFSDAMKRDRSYNPYSAAIAATEKTWSTAWFILDSLKKLIVGDMSTKTLGGPITIAKIAGDSADAGWQAFFTLIAVMSVMLGVVNLLPIPVLDGGHLLFYIIEAVKGSPLNETIQGVAMRLGMIMVFGITFLALYNDFARL